MSTLNLKSMYNDPSQMREALAWRLFGRGGRPGVPAHLRQARDQRRATRACTRVIEQVDKRFLHDRFGDERRGQPLQGLLRRRGLRDAGAPGRSRRRRQRPPVPAPTAPTIRPTGSRPTRTTRRANSYDDLAELVRMINGVGLPGGDGRFDTDAFRASVEDVFDARAFLRWAGVNVLIGQLGQLLRHAVELLPLQLRPAGDEHGFMAPVLHVHPLGLRQQLRHRLLRHRLAVHRPARLARATPALPAASRARCSRIPLVTEPARQPRLPRVLPGPPGAPAGHRLHARRRRPSDRRRRRDGLWDRVSQAAYLESGTPDGPPFTGRQFTNDEVYRSGVRQQELRHGDGERAGHHPLRAHAPRQRPRSSWRSCAAGTAAGAAAADFPADARATASAAGRDDAGRWHGRHAPSCASKQEAKCRRRCSPGSPDRRLEASGVLAKDEMLLRHLRQPAATSPGSARAVRRRPGQRMIAQERGARPRLRGHRARSAPPVASTC